MKPYLLSSFKNKILLASLFAGILATTLNSCTVSSELSYQTYSPPAWAPPYDDVSSVQYYYFPDYDMYYDVWGSQFWYNSNGVWVPSGTLPAAYADVNLYNAYVVLVNKKYATPWVRHDYFVKNYPPHVYDNYQDIVVTNRIVKKIEPNHDLVPRAYNENTNRVTFMQRQRDANSQQNQQSVQGSERQPTDRNPNQHQPTPGITSQPTQPVQGSERQPFNRQPNQQQPVQGTESQPIDRNPNQHQPTPGITPQPIQGSERQPFSRQPNQQQPVQGTESQPIDRNPNQHQPTPGITPQPTQPIQGSERPPFSRQPNQQQPEQNTSATPTYHRISQEVPMKSIRPYLQPQPQNQNRNKPN